VEDELGFGVAEPTVRCDVVEQVAACHAVGGSRVSLPSRLEESCQTDQETK
jgi:hypothetical protein